MKKLFLLIILLPILANAENWTRASFSATQRACEQKHNPHACHELAIRQEKGIRGSKRQGYNALFSHANSCDYAKDLATADRYCPKGLAAMSGFTSAACYANETYHHLCEMGSKTACLQAAQMNRTGWHGSKEPCRQPEIYGDGKPSPQRVAKYTRKATQAKGDTPHLPTWQK